MKLKKKRKKDDDENQKTKWRICLGFEGCGWINGSVKKRERERGGETNGRTKYNNWVNDRVLCNRESTYYGHMYTQPNRARIMDTQVE